MITASHNPAEYNGIKIFDSNGEKIGEDLQTEIERRFAKQTVVSAENIGKITQKLQFKADYFKFLINFGIKLDGLKVVLDCSNGANYQLAKRVFKHLGAKVFTTSCTNNGANINKNCGALFPQKLAKLVLEKHADVGFAFDGDADRVVMVDENGTICDGDQIILFLTKMYQKYGLLKTNAVVTTIQTNMAIETELGKLGIKLLRTDVGDQYVTNKLKTEHLQIGGEQAGHIILFDHEKSGDGLFCAVQVAKFLKLSGEPLSKNVFYELFPQFSKNIVVTDKYKIINSANFKAVVTECENMLSGAGRIVTRASGTEPKIRLMVETQNEALAKEILTKLENATK